MDAEEIVTQALNRAGRLAGDATYQGYALDELNTLIQSLESGATVGSGGFFLPWFLLTEDSTAETTANESRLLLPIRFLQEYEEGSLDHVKADGTVVGLTKKDLQRLDRTATGDPKFYALGANYFYLAPVPTAAITIRMKYYQSSEAITAPTAGKTNGWTANAPHLLVAGVTAAIAASYLYNTQLAAIEQGKVQMALRGLHMRHEARINANLEGSVGEDT